jgi:hypothetical protein
MNDPEKLDSREILERIFKTVLEEATFNKSFAEKLIQALPKQAIARIETRKRAPKKKEEPVSLQRLMRMEGEQALRKYLSKRGSNCKNLRKIAFSQQIPLSDEARRLKKMEPLVEEIIEGVKFRIADRRAAAS